LPLSIPPDSGLYAMINGEWNDPRFIDDPTRDPGFHCVSILYVCRAFGAQIGADDTKEAFVYSLEGIPYENLVFDHARLLLCQTGLAYPNGLSTVSAGIISM
jgi:hypothetical protein